MLKKSLAILAAISVSAVSYAFAQENPVIGVLPDVTEVYLQTASWQKVEGRNTLNINLCSVRERTYCSVPYDRKFNLSGKRATQGVSIRPAIEGEWRWDGDYTLAFTPKNAWPAGESYTVTTDAALFPASLRNTSPTLNFNTQVLRPRITEMKFFQDPTDLTKKVISSSISFNYPIEKEALEKHLTFTMEAIKDGAISLEAEKLPYELTMQEEDSQAVVSVPIKALPDVERAVTAVVGEGLMAKSGGRPLVHEATNVAEDKRPEYERPRTTERTALPSIYSYLKIEPLESTVVKNEKYQPEQVMMFTINAPLSADELKKNLTLKMLPKDKPSVVEGQSPKKDYVWASANEVTPEVLKEATPVEYTITTDAEEKLTSHTLKFTAEPGRYLYATVAKGLKTHGDYMLGQEFTQVVQSPVFAKEIAIMSQGAVLSLSGDKKIPIFSLGAKQLDFRISRIKNDDISHLVSQSYGNFASPSFNNYSFNEDNISEVFTETRSLENADDKTPQFTSFDFTPYVEKEGKGKGLYFLSIQYKEKDENGIERVKAEDKRFILLTDLGFLAKTNADGSRELFVQSLEDGEPVSGVDVEVMGKNGLPVLSVETDGDGHATLPSLSGYTNEKEPVAYVVRDGDDDVSFMPFGRYDREVNYSNFDTSGNWTSGEGLRAYLFSDRGIYRPGEQFHIGMIVKQGDMIADLSGLPLMLELTNPRGQVIDKKTLTLNAQGFIEYDFTTQNTSATGIYNVRLFIGKDGKQGEQIGNTAVRVEEFLPDSLKITSAFDKKPEGWVKPDALKANVTLMNLFGTPAVGNNVKGRISLSPAGFALGGEYKDFQFYNPAQGSKSFDEEVGEQVTDDVGKAAFDLNLAAYKDSTYRLTFFAEGFVKGSGRSVKSATSILVSPREYVVGVKADGRLDYIDKDSERRLQFVAVNGEAKKASAVDLTLELYRATYVSTLVKDNSGRYSYQSQPKEKLLEQSPIDVDLGGVFYPLNTKEPGDFILRLKDKDGTLLNELRYMVAGYGNITGAMQKDAKLGIALDKPEYVPGEEMRINLVTPYTGSGLITIETDKVLAYQWFEADSTNSVQSIRIPNSLYGKAFVNVQFVRARSDREIYTAPFSFGVVPFKVSTDAMDSKPQLTVPQMVKPGEVLHIGYSMKKPGKIAVYAVDEGILLYGKYKMPDPLEYLVNSRALQVATSQIYDLLMPEYSLFTALSAFGGDESLADGKNLNPFKRKTLPPVVFWSGVIDASPDVKEITYTVPDYFNGALRVMAVAVGDGTVGAGETKTLVKGDLIVAPNAPTFVAPGDEFEIPVTITNNLAGSGKDAEIALVAAPSEQVEIVSIDKAVKVAEGKDATVNVKVKAKDVPGGASILFTVSKGEASAKYEATLSVRPAMEATTELVSGYIAAGEKVVANTRRLYKPFSKADAAVSGLPLSLLPGLAEYLDKYPYGCTEQIVSKALPAIVLYNNKEFGKLVTDVEKSTSLVLSRLREMQNYEGGFGYWWSDSEASDFATVYALHYMTLAKEKNLPVPTDMMDNTLRYMRQMVSRSITSLEQARNTAYGIYLMTRNGEVTANYLPYLLQYLEENQKDAWKNDLTAVYLASTYKLMQLNPEAEKLMDEFTLGEPKFWDNNTKWWDQGPFYNSLVRYSQYLYLLSQHFPDRLKTFDRNILFRVANFIGEGSYSTLTSSYAILGIDAYASAVSELSAAVLGISEKDADGKFVPLNLEGDQVKRASFTPDTPELRFVGDEKLGLFYQLATSGYDRVLPEKPIEQGLEISRSFTNEAGAEVKEVTLGEEVNVTIRMRAHLDKELENMAVVDLLPGGFEVVEGSAKTTNDPVDDKSTPWTARAKDVREDRVILFGTVPAYEVTYRYKIKAVNVGSFILPPAYVESMYERSVRATSVPGSIVVK